jgi:hypothetical protein
LNSDVGRNFVYVLVEGVDDCKIYSKFFDKKTSSIEFVCGGKGQTILALEGLNTITKKILGICDADFRHLENDYPSIPNLFFTDCHDIEMTMLSVTGVLDNALTEYGLQNDTSKILQKALGECEFSGYTRWYNEQNIIKLDFSRINLGGVVSPHDINATLDTNTYLNQLNTRSVARTKTVFLADIVNFMQTNSTSDLFNLCNGHDVTALIALIIGGAVSCKSFCSILRASFKMADFVQCKMYANILSWQNANSFAILI